ncbi:hypothetical protein QQ045_003410 [Rhodiola kirilowii]
MNTTQPNPLKYSGQIDDGFGSVSAAVESILQVRNSDGSSERIGRRRQRRDEEDVDDNRLVFTYFWDRPKIPNLNQTLLDEGLSTTEAGEVEVLGIAVESFARGALYTLLRRSEAKGLNQKFWISQCFTAKLASDVVYDSAGQYTLIDNTSAPSFWNAPSFIIHMHLRSNQSINPSAPSFHSIN